MAIINKQSAGKASPVNGTDFDDKITLTANPSVAQSSSLNFDLVNAGAGDDVVKTGVGNDEVNAGDGNDTVRGGGGFDNIYGGSGNDKLLGQAGNDRLFGGDGNDKIVGGKGNDRIDGGEGNDRVYGGDGSDLIRGGNGDDVLYGDVAGDKDDEEEHADYFVFDLDDGNDQVFDFDENVDKIVLEDGGSATFVYNATSESTVMTYGNTTVIFRDSFVDMNDVFVGNIDDIFPLA